MEWGTLTIATITGPAAAWLFKSILQKALPSRRVVMPEKPLLFWNGEKDQIVKQVNSLREADIATDRQVTQIFGLLGDQDRRIDQLEELLRRHMLRASTSENPPA
jgi:hypothetical protein